MPRRLRVTVHVHRDGVSHRFRPGDAVPDWAAELITNPDVWADDTPGEAPPAEPAIRLAAQPPPRSGRGSGRDAWVDFAAVQGVGVDDDASRDEIIADLEEREVISKET
jgi:hypothetical protein